MSPSVWPRVIRLVWVSISWCGRFIADISEFPSAENPKTSGCHKFRHPPLVRLTAGGNRDVTVSLASSYPPRLGIRLHGVGDLSLIFQASYRRECGKSVTFRGSPSFERIISNRDPLNQD
ncbi:hypothetical protein CEXT_229781 [Caerostris extrusa]|uniref:Secreted protein n=1 Tax=Caerostris extrusa TaxID=172846 RepID=A0AAV4YAB4_CAEEX|nr:hypothetical protein CEXT_229781 [Caerostris extrusa]